MVGKVFATKITKWISNHFSLAIKNALPSKKAQQ